MSPFDAWWRASMVGKAAAWAALLFASGLAFIDLATSGKLMIAVVEGVLIPLSVIHELRWWRSHTPASPETVVLRMMPIVAGAIIAGLAGR